MKVTLNVLKNISQVYKTGDDVTKVGVDKLVEQIGSQLGAVDEVTELGKNYQGIVIAKVVSCEKHADADKLSVCRIDDGKAIKDVERGDDGLVQVVCGAPNVREGLTVAWLPPGSTVPSTVGKEPFVLEAREIRGQKSNGMLASPKELALGDSHEGILEIDGEHAPGSDFAKEFKLDEEVVIDIENKMFTHRPDCFGWLGIARELSGIQGRQFASPDWYIGQPEFAEVEGESLPLIIKNEAPELVPRFTAITMKDVTVGASPVWLQVLLAKVGQKSINNIVDLTNYYMLLTGQPIHAYDYDKVKTLSGAQPTIVIRQSQMGEKLKLLNGKEVEPRPEAIMIATDKQAIGIGGVMGGSETEVDAKTKNIIIEVANFDMYSIRRTSMAHGLFTDAGTRFTKGQSPLKCLAISAKIVNDIAKLSGAKVAGKPIDIHRDLVASPVVRVSAKFINDRLGLKLSPEKIAAIMKNVEFDLIDDPKEIIPNAMEFGVPFWRTDIEIPEDIVEEVGRLYGFDKLPLELPQLDLTPAEKDPLLETKAAIRDSLSKAGANEVLTYSFIHGNLLEKVGQNREAAYQIANALSPDLQYYRLSIVPSLLEKIHPNIKAGYDEFALFEIGKTHSINAGNDDQNLPFEFESTSLVVTAGSKAKRTGAAFYKARKFLEALVPADRISLKQVPDSMKDYPGFSSYDGHRVALVEINGEPAGAIGELKPSIAASLKLPKFTAAFEIDTTKLMSVVTDTSGYEPLSRYPSVKQDITLRVAADLAYQELFDFVSAQLTQQQPKDTTPSLEPIDIYQAEDDKDHKNVTLRLSIASFDRTLTDAEVNKLLDTVAAAAKAKLNAERI